MLRIPRVLSVYAAGTAEHRWHLANYREQPTAIRTNFMISLLAWQAYARRTLNSSPLSRPAPFICDTR